MKYLGSRFTWMIAMTLLLTGVAISHGSDDGKFICDKEGECVVRVCDGGGGTCVEEYYFCDESSKCCDDDGVCRDVNPESVLLVEKLNVLSKSVEAEVPGIVEEQDFPTMFEKTEAAEVIDDPIVLPMFEEARGEKMQARDEQAQ